MKVKGDLLQTEEIGTLPPPLKSLNTSTLLPISPDEAGEEVGEEAAWSTRSRKTFKSENYHQHRSISLTGLPPSTRPVVGFEEQVV